MSAEDFDDGMRRIEELVARVEAVCSPEALPLVRELVRTLLELHANGLRELFAALETAGASGVDLVGVVRSRPVLAGLLLMHELHPESLETRVRRAVREANDAAGGRAQVELVGLSGADAIVALTGKGDGAGLLERALERLVCEHAPEATLHVERQKAESAGPAAFERLIPAERLRAKLGGVR